jgi:hypothetical protein
MESRWEDLLDVEVRRATGWLQADRTLGLSLLLGPLARRTHWGVDERREEGYLDENQALTLAGLWRVAYLASQGIGWVERRRAQALVRATPRRYRAAGGRPRSPRWLGASFSPTHLRETQRLCLELMDSGAVPLGVEWSLMGMAIQGLFGYRPDALLVAADGSLVWVEFNRRPIGRDASTRAKYRHLEEGMLAHVCSRLGRNLRFILVAGGARRELLYTVRHLYPTEATR